MILLSALLASLTGLVSGERPVQRAQVELSAVAAIVQPGKAVAHAGARPANVLPRRAILVPHAASSERQAPARGARALLLIKQSWLN